MSLRSIFGLTLNGSRISLKILNLKIKVVYKKSIYLNFQKAILAFLERAILHSHWELMEHSSITEIVYGNPV